MLFLFFFFFFKWVGKELLFCGHGSVQERNLFRLMQDGGHIKMNYVQIHENLHLHCACIPSYRKWTVFFTTQQLKTSQLKIGKLYNFLSSIPEIKTLLKHSLHSTLALSVPHYTAIFKTPLRALLNPVDHKMDSTDKNCFYHAFVYLSSLQKLVLNAIK